MMCKRQEICEVDHAASIEVKGRVGTGGDRLTESGSKGQEVAEVDRSAPVKVSLERSGDGPASGG